jgi:hypothetical protein
MNDRVERLDAASHATDWSNIVQAITAMVRDPAMRFERQRELVNWSD